MKWELFLDESFYEMWAVRPEGDKDFNSPRLFHFGTKEEAQVFKDLAESAKVAESSSLSPTEAAEGLPTWQHCRELKEAGEILNPIEHFIHENEPAGFEDSEAFRTELLSAIHSIGASWQSSQPGWISVGKELPEFVLHHKTTSDKVVILFDGYVTIGSIYKKYGEKPNVWFTMDDTFDEQFDLPVTHWCKLPAPPVQTNNLKQ